MVLNTDGLVDKLTVAILLSQYKHTIWHKALAEENLTNPPKFYPPKIFIRVNLPCKAFSLLMFFPPNILGNNPLKLFTPKDTATDSLTSL